MWTPCKDNNKKEVCWENGEIKIILEEGEIINEELKGKLAEECREFAIPKVFVQEWKELWVHVKSDTRNVEIEKIWFGKQETQQKPNGWWTYTFRNYLGKSLIRIKFKDGQELTTDPIEVISSKTSLYEKEKNGKLPYCKFLKALIDSLIRHLASSPFDFVSPTGFPSEEYTQPPSLVFILHILAQNADNIIQALQTIWHNPYRKLATEERWVLLNETKNVDADTAIMMLQHPEYLQAYSENSEDALQHLAERLEKHVPKKIFERQFVETLDNSENRFIKRLMDTVLYWCEELKIRDYWQIAELYKEKLEELEDYVRYLRTDPLFADVGDMTIFPATSQVLLKRDGYRECLNIYRLLNISRMPTFDKIQEAIDNRRIDILYEYWCFFKLANLLAKIIGGEGAKPKFQTVENPRGGLGYETEADLGDGYKLVYNKTFRGEIESYSISLRPDFSLMKNGKVEVVFDAKFRFELKDLKEIQNKDLENEVGEPLIERLAKVEDIYKMHTYRDALQNCYASVVLFPGSEGVFYFYSNANADKPREIKESDVSMVLEEIIRNKWQGVGAFPLKIISNKEMRKNG